MKAGVVAVIAGPLALVTAIVFGVVIVVASSANACERNTGSVDVSRIGPGTSIGPFDTEQVLNAAAIMNAAAKLELGPNAQRLGVMTAIGESTLRVLEYGDDAGPDSRGLFQQRDSWGSLEDRLNPERSATLFFERLKAVPGWEKMLPSHAAHAVQINADPDHYTRFVDQADSLVTEITAMASTTGGSCTTGEAAYPLDQPYMMTDDFGPRPAYGVGNSTWHPAVDLHGTCKAPVYAVLPGTVTASSRLTLSVQSQDGFTVSYLHTFKSERLVDVGDVISTGQQIAVVGNEGPSTGCHLDLRISTLGNTNADVDRLPQDPNAPGMVNPEDFMRLYGVELCPTEWCTRNVG